MSELPINLAVIPYGKYDRFTRLATSLFIGCLVFYGFR